MNWIILDYTQEFSGIYCIHFINDNYWKILKLSWNGIRIKKQHFLGVGLAVKDTSELHYKQQKLIVPHISTSCVHLENRC